MATGGIVYHVLNRRVGRALLFEKPADYTAFEQILQEAHSRTEVRFLAYCLMPNHWHLLLWPQADGELSEIMRWITVTHSQRWHAHRHTSGTGPVYQGRFKAFPVQTDKHFLTVARYVERNALRANLVGRAEDWPWSSLWYWLQGNSQLLSMWPVKRPADWVERVNEPHLSAEIDSLRCSVRRGRPFGSELWVEQISKRLGLEFTLRSAGRPKSDFTKRLPTPF